MLTTNRIEKVVASSVVVMALLAMESTPAAAQDDAAIEVSAGYLNVSGTMHGWNVQVAKSLTSEWAVIGEVNGAYGPDPGERRPIYHDVAVLGGIRRSWPRRGVAPFAQFVVGARHASNRDDGSAIDYLALQPGGGVTFMVSPRFGVRTQVDLQIASPFDASYDGVSVFPQATVGAVLRFGVR